MAFTLIPTANQTPDATLGGVAVTGITNTGHASTVALAADGSAETKSARWFTFQGAPGQVLSITLKIDHTTTGALSGAGASNLLALEYSINGGSSWLAAASRSNISDSQGPTTFSVALSPGQNISQIQVRENMFAQTLDAGESASVTTTIANIKLEVVTGGGAAIVIM